VPTSALRPEHHGAGLVDIFQNYRYLVPEFEHELFFRGFLVAFGRQVRETLQRDSDSHPVTHWWRGPLGTTDSQFADSSQGHAWALFNQAGRQQLAHNLAVETFRALELYYSHGCYKAFFESAAKLVGSDFLEGYLESIPADIAAEPVPELPKIVSAFALDQASVKAKKNNRTSETMLAKRLPDLTPEEIEYRERKRRNNDAYKAKQRALKEAARESRLESPRKVMVGRSEP
jgi:hypothetical protein